MAFAIKAELKGLQQALASLQRLKQSVQNAVLRTALTQASTPVLKTARSLTPRRSGQLKKSLGRKVKTYRSRGTVVVIIGPRTGFKTMWRGRPVNPTQYAHLVHGGRKAVVPKRAKVLTDGQGRFFKRARASTPNPFLERAFKATSSQAVLIARQVIAAELAKLQAKKAA